MSFTSKGSAVVFLTAYKPSIVEDDIPDYFITAADQEINLRSDTQWEEDSSDQTVLIDGTGENHIHVPTIPILDITSVKIIRNDETETSLTVSGSTRQLRWNAETGVIHRTGAENDVFLDLDDKFREGTIFPVGIANIEVIGRFGRATNADTLRLLANLIILRMMSRLDPKNFKANVIMEEIGEYRYQLAHIDRSTEGNEPLTLDGHINYLFSILPKDDALYIEAV